MSKTGAQRNRQAELEIHLHAGPATPESDKVSGYLIAYNEKKLGVKRKTAFMSVSVNGEVIGGISFRWYGPSAFLDWVAVEEKWRGQGVGGKLLLAVEEELRLQGCNQICVHTESYQAPRFYERRGYDCIATAPGVVCGYDRLIFRKFLPEKVIA